MTTSLLVAGSTGGVAVAAVPTAEVPEVGMKVMKVKRFPLTSLGATFGGPADKAGLHAGEDIIQIDGKDVVPLELDQAVALLKGPAGSRVELTIVEIDNPRSHKVTIVRGGKVADAAWAPFVPDAPRAAGAHADPPPAAAVDARPAPAPADTRAQLFRTLVVRDTLNGDIPAYRMLVPADWKVDASIAWDAQFRSFNCMQTPLAACAPKGIDGMFAFPREAFYDKQIHWDINAPAGHMEDGHELQHVLGVGDFVARIVLPRYHAQGRAAKIVAVEDCREVGRAAELGLGQPPILGAQNTARGGRVRIEYTLGKTEVEEDIYCTLVYLYHPAGGGSTSWGPTYLYSFRAERGRLDARTREVFGTMFNSIEMNPTWVGMMNQVRTEVCQLILARMRHGKRLTDIAQQAINDAGNARHESWARQQASRDEVAGRWADALGGVNRYVDPQTDRTYDVGLGAGNVWISRDSAGSVLISGDPTYNPNVGGTTTWQELKPIR